MFNTCKTHPVIVYLVICLVISFIFFNNALPNTTHKYLILSPARAHAAAPSTYPSPILFVHGLASDAGTWKKVKKHLKKMELEFGGNIKFGRRFLKPKASDGDFYTIEFSDNQNLSFEEQGQELKHAVDLILKAKSNKAAKVCLVGHSMGGLAIRSYLAKDGAVNVSGVVTINTPHIGSLLGMMGDYVKKHPDDKRAKRIRGLLKTFGGLNLDSKAVMSLNPGSQQILALSKKPLPDSIPYVCLVGRWEPAEKSNLVPELLSHYDRKLHRDYYFYLDDSPYTIASAEVHMNWSDGIVSVWSQYLKSAGAWTAKLDITSIVTGDFHTDATGNVEAIGRALRHIFHKTVSAIVATGSQSRTPGNETVLLEWKHKPGDTDHYFAESTSSGKLSSGDIITGKSFLHTRWETKKIKDSGSIEIAVTVAEGHQEINGEKVPLPFIGVTQLLELTRNGRFVSIKPTNQYIDYKSMLIEFPSRAIAIGDSWTTRANLDLYIKIGMEARYTLTGFKTVNGFECAVIKANITFDPGKNNSEGILSMKTAGTEYFAHRDGKLVKADHESAVHYVLKELSGSNTSVTCRENVHTVITLAEVGEPIHSTLPPLKTPPQAETKIPVKNSSSTGRNESDETRSTSSLKIVIVPSLTSVFSVGKTSLVVLIEGPVEKKQVIKNVSAAIPVTVTFSDIPAGRYTVKAWHGSSHHSKEIDVHGDTLCTNFIMH